MTHHSAVPDTLAAPLAAPLAASDVHLVRVADDLWRVVDRRGRALGHLQAAQHPLGLRYRARRYHAATGGFRDLGDFWSPADAIDSLRAG